MDSFFTDFGYSALKQIIYKQTMNDVYFKIIRYTYFYVFIPLLVYLL